MLQKIAISCCIAVAIGCIVEIRIRRSRWESTWAGVNQELLGCEREPTPLVRVESDLIIGHEIVCRTWCHSYTSFKDPVFLCVPVCVISIVIENMLPHPSIPIKCQVLPILVVLLLLLPVKLILLIHLLRLIPLHRIVTTDPIVIIVILIV